MNYGYSNEDIIEVMYAFWGGEFDGQLMDREAVEAIADGQSPDNSKKRAMGCLCPRAELDRQPTVEGYYGPMYDGVRYVLSDGSTKYDFEVVDRTKISRAFVVLRYESPDTYARLSE